MPTANESLTLRDRIARERLPLPSHDLDGAPSRAWAVAACHAEVEHRAADFTRVVTRLGVAVDRYLDPDVVELGQYQHEAYAAAALNWHGHIVAHDSDRHGPWAIVRWALWTRDEKVEWLRRRQYLLRGFLRQVRKYREARALIDRPALKAAA